MKIYQKIFAVSGSILLFSTSFAGLPNVALANATEPHYVQPTYKVPINIALTNGNHNQYLSPNQTFTLSTSYSIAEARNFVLAPGTYSVNVSGSTVTLTQNGKTIFSTSDSMTIFPINYSFSSLLKLSTNNRSYLGSMKFQPGRIINIVPLEHYLYGVVPHEIGEGSHAESQKVQAVSARTFAARRANMVMQDNTLHQVYRGYNPSHVRSIKAVNDTRGQLMKQGSTIIETFFSASNGGTTLSVANSWGARGTQLPYLVRKTDTFDTAHSWSFSLREHQLDLSKLDVQNPLNWWKTTHEVDASHPQLSGLKKYMVGKTSGPKNNDFKITKLSIEFTTPENTIINYNTYLNGKVVADYVYLDQDNKLVSATYTLSDRTYNFYSGYVFGSIGNFSAIRSPNVKSVKNTNGVIQISGSGWGHGIGMSQNGAMSRANAGHSYLSILSFYYDGVTITPVESGEVFVNHPAESKPVTTPPVTTVPDDPSTDEFDIHIFASGDTLYRLSLTYNTTVSYLQEINNIANPSSIPVGFRLKIPKQNSSVPEPDPVPETPAPEPEPETPEPEPETEFITTSLLTGLYKSLNRSERIAVIPPGTKIPVIEKDNSGLVKVVYDNLEGWAKIDSNTVRTYIGVLSGIFDAPNVNANYVFSITPQYVHIIQTNDDGWHLIQTDKGDLWTKSGYLNRTTLQNISGVYTTPVEKDRIAVVSPTTTLWVFETLPSGWSQVLYDNKLYWMNDGITSYQTALTKTSGLFASPSVTSTFFGSVPAGTVNVMEDGPAGWKKIQVSTSEYWTQNGLLKDYTIPKDLALYGSKSLDDRTSFLEKDTVVQLLNPLVSGWNQISYNGSLHWINPDAPFETYQFKELTGLFSDPSNRVERISSVSNQKLVVLQTLADGWMLVETTHGPLWAKPGYYDRYITPITLKTTSGLYAEPGSVKRISTLPAGTVLDSLRTNSDGWHEVLHNDERLWVKDGYAVYQTYLTKTTGLFPEHNPTQHRLGALTPQRITVIDTRPDGWMLIQSWLGELWAKDGVIDSITLNRASGLYNSTNSFEREALVSAGRTFLATNKTEDGWYYIETSAGEKWIKDGYTTYRTYMSQPSALFASEGGFSAPAGLIQPQFIIVVESGADGWRKIATWKGDLWMKTGVTTSQVPYTYHLTSTSGLFESPDGALMSYVSPQKVTVLEVSANGWMKINTWLGDLWVKDGVLKPQFPFSYQLNQVSGLYSAPGSKRVSSLSPQRVSVIDVASGGWVKVNTWLGPLWTKNGYTQ